MFHIDIGMGMPSSLTIIMIVCLFCFLFPDAWTNHGPQALFENVVRNRARV